MQDNSMALDSYQTVSKLVLERLEAICADQRQQAESLHPMYGRLWQAITDQVLGGGKRLRPYLTVIASQAYGTPHAPPALIDVAAAWELLHVSMLMHDDIVDRDYQRHGQINVAGQYLLHYEPIKDYSQRLHYAHSAALLAGDLVLSAAHKLIDTSGLPASTIAQVQEIFYEATFEVVGGELLDMEASVSGAVIDLQLIAALKTASYSIIGPLLSGAVIAGAPILELEKLRTLGMCLGIGFQLADDMLGIFGDELVTGKPANSDLAEGKRTQVVEVAFQLMTETGRAAADKLLAEPSVENAVVLKKMIESTEVKPVVKKQLDACASKAQQIIDGLSVEPDSKITLTRLVGMLLDRAA